MVKKSGRKAEAAASQKKPSPGQARLSVEITDSTSSSYVNHIEVGHSDHEFFLMCARLPTKLSKTDIELAKASGELRLEAMVQVLIPPTLVSGLIAALQMQKEQFEKKHGALRPNSIALLRAQGAKNGGGREH